MSINIVRVITKSLFFSLLFTIIFIIVLGGYIYERNRHYSDAIYPNVFINDTNFSGMNRADVQNHFIPINKSLQSTNITISYDDSIATFSGEMLHLKYDVDTISAQAFSIGRSPNEATKYIQQIFTILNLNSYKFSYKPQYDLRMIDNFLAEVQETYSKPAQDALFDVDNGKVTAFRFHENGIIVNTETSRANIVDFLSQIGSSQNKSIHVVLENEILRPNITLEDANDFGILEVIGIGKSDYTGSAAYRVHNVEHAATQFHGVLIPPGEVFSYNETIGDISRATGYVAGYVIKNGRTVLGDGGGVCQDSTTLFRAALDSGLPIIERKAHAYRVKYYENDRKPGFDATVYAPSVDLKFLNDTPAHILIQSEVDSANKTLTFIFYGKRDGRVVELSDATVYDIRPAPEPIYEETADLPRGVTKQVDWAAGGAKSSFTYKVTALDGTIIEDRTFYSSYRPWPAVYQVGIRD